MVPPNRHQTKMLEQPHCPIGSILIRRSHFDPDVPLPRLILSILPVSNDLYASGVYINYKASKRRTFPEVPDITPVAVH